MSVFNCASVCQCLIWSLNLFDLPTFYVQSASLLENQPIVVNKHTLSVLTLFLQHFQLKPCQDACAYQKTGITFFRQANQPFHVFEDRLLGIKLLAWDTKKHLTPGPNTHWHRQYIYKYIGIQRWSKVCLLPLFILTKPPLFYHWALIYPSTYPARDRHIFRNFYHALFLLSMKFIPQTSWT